MRAIFATTADPMLTLMRITLAAIFFGHGAQKAPGWFGGYGWSATIQMFHTAMHIPVFFAVLAILAEFGGSIVLFFGFLSRVAAFGLAVDMLVAIFTVHLKNGLYAPNGFGFPLSLLALAVLILIKGAGAWSVDGVIAGEPERLLR